MIKKRPAALRYNILGLFPQGEHTEAVLQRQPRLYMLLAIKLGSLRVTKDVLVLKVCRVLKMKEMS